MANKYQVTITREKPDPDDMYNPTMEIEIDVTVGHQEGAGPTWHDPGEPEEWWIEDAECASTGKTVELDETERESAILLAIGRQKQTSQEG